MGIPEIVQNPTELRNLFQADKVFIGGIEVDVLSVETKTQKWTTTRRPVEAGLDISDNRYKEPEQLRIQGWLMDTDISLSAAIDAAANALLGGPSFDLTTWEAKKEALETLANSNEIFTIVTRLDVYESIQADFLSVEHTKDTSRGYPFVLEVTQLHQVSSQVTTVDPSQVPKSIRDQETPAQETARAKGAKPVKKGKKPTPPATETDLDPLRSFGF